MNRTNKGFTLVELLVVLAIISLLLTIALPRYFSSVDKSREIALKENLQVLRSGIDKYYADKGEYPAALADLVNHHYFRKIPLDPVTESAATWQLLPSADAEKPGVADIRSGAKGKTRDGTPYQQL
ncbi:type II secretion system GspH family protein [Oxalobacteraceae bacterium OTU3REALA1]|nr:type II secretion system GspH family protein [Oxalobacteraceae bacterium OTU3REALA1]